MDRLRDAVEERIASAASASAGGGTSTAAAQQPPGLMSKWAKAALAALHGHETVALATAHSDEAVPRHLKAVVLVTSLLVMLVRVRAVAGLVVAA